MTDSNKVNEATWNLTNSIRETNQAIADSTVSVQERSAKYAQSVFENGIEVLKSQAESTRSLMQEMVNRSQEQPQDYREQRGTFQALANSAVAAQERNIRFAQSIFENGLEVLKSNTESTRSLMQTVVEQSRKQQDAFQSLAHESVNAYIDFLRAPMPYYQQAIDAAQSATRQGLENVQGAVRQGVETAQRADQQAQNAANGATE